MAIYKRFLAKKGLDNNSFTLENVADPVNAQDGVTKNFLVSGIATLANKTITGSSTTGVDKGTVSSGTVTFTVSDGAYQRLQVGGALTIAFTDWATSGNLSAIQVEAVNWGSAAVTTPTINWQLPAGGFTTTFATYLTAIGRSALQTSGTDWMVFWSVDNGTTIYGKLV